MKPCLLDQLPATLPHTTGSPWPRGFGALVMGFLPALLLVAGCDQTRPTAQAKKPIEVIVTTPITSEVADYQDFTGRLDALKTVDIRARVSGFVMTAPFKEGDLVHEGDPLFQIDERTYRATYNQAEANLKQAIADRNLQEKNTNRAKRMIEGRSLSMEDYDTTLATYEKAKATVGSMEAARDMAKLYLDFTKVTAPLTGRISRRLVDPGNLVIADNTILTTIVADSTLYAYFDVDERTYLDLMGTAAPGQASWLAGLQFPVMMRLANEEDFTRTGTVNFVDNRVSASSGTIRMRGVFENPTGMLKPGLFVRIRLPIGTPYKAVLIPDEALLSDQGRKYVYVVKNKIDPKTKQAVFDPETNKPVDEVEYRPVTLGQDVQGLRVIKKGLSMGERVIVSGMQRVRQGAEVSSKDQKPPKAPPSPLAKLLTANLSQAKADKETGRPGDNRTNKEGPGSAQAGN
jgi:RND family efflux transporter MFP subunit